MLTGLPKKVSVLFFDFGLVVGVVFLDFSAPWVHIFLAKPFPRRSLSVTERSSSEDEKS